MHRVVLGGIVGRMAPRPLESKAQFLVRLKKSWRADGSARIGVGQHHHTHGVVLESGRLKVRRLVLPEGAAEAAATPAVGYRLVRAVNGFRQAHAGVLPCS